MAEQGATTEILWDTGTAYDLFASLNALHNPGEFGLRPSWAAGIRARLSLATRQLFTSAMVQPLGKATASPAIPAVWLYRLAPPKQAGNVLERLESMAPEQILPALAFNPDSPEKCDAVLRRVMERGSWTKDDAAEYLTCGEPSPARSTRRTQGSVERWLEWWTRPVEAGIAYRTALREYYESFFRDEERRIASEVDRSLQRAKELASRLPLPELFEELSQGVRVEHLLTQRSLVLVPCYWCTPRIIYASLKPGQLIVLFGARPPEASLVPGDAVPARLLLALEALSDPTRLTILRTLAEQPLTQAEIARKLRLRPPTISHHLKSLRLAGLIALIGTGKDETRYGARVQQLSDVGELLRQFLKPS